MDIIDAFTKQYMNVPNFVGAWTNSTNYVTGQNVLDTSDSHIYTAQITHTSAVSPTTFSADRIANPTYWIVNPIGSPGTTYAPIDSPGFTGGPTAPTPATTDNDTSIATTAFVQSAASVQNNVGRNLVHNPMFRVAQRGNGPFTANVYTADRWLAQSITDTISYIVGTMSDADRTQIGDEEASRYLSNSFVGSAAAGACNYMHHRIENVRRLAGKTVTISFWANCGAGTPKIGINVLQFFGTGGSPSTQVRALATGRSVTISTTWTRYQVTIAIPTIVGKTLGSNGDDYTAIELWFSSGATFNTAAGNIGVQTAAISLWGVQVEVGPVRTPLEKPDPQVDFANCQRFYQSGQILYAGYAVAATTIYQTVTTPVQMRATPGVTPTNNASVNMTSPTALNGAVSSVIIGNGTVTGTGGFVLNVLYTAAADL